MSEKKFDEIIKIFNDEKIISLLKNKGSHT